MPLDPAVYAKLPRLPSAPVDGPRVEQPTAHPDGAQGVLQGQPVHLAQVDQPLAQEIPQGRPRSAALLVPQEVQARPLGPTAREVAQGTLPTADELKQSIGADPKKDVRIGMLTFTRSSQYKDVLGQLEALHDTVGRTGATPTRSDLSTVAAQLEVLDRSLQRYADAPRVTHRQEMAQLREAVQGQLMLLRRLDGELAMGRAWPQGLGLPQALAYLKANPDLGLAELDVAFRHGLSAADVKAYADARTPINDATIPGGAQLQGELQRLGSGATATVYKGLFHLADGSPMQGVLKADQKPDHLPSGAEHIGIDVERPNLALRTVATSKLNDRLKFTLVPHTEIVLHEGQLCTVMGLAEGKSPLISGNFKIKMSPGVLNMLANDPELLREVAQAKGWQGAHIEDGELVVENTIINPRFDDEPETRESKREADTMVAFDFKDPNLRRELTRLQWFDILCGQADRHAHNYFVNKGPDGKLHVTAIDNDLAFGRNTVHANDLHGQVGLNGARLPGVIDAETRDELMRLEPEELDELLDGLLLPDEIAATKSRLGEIKDHIRELERVGRVCTNDEQWTHPEVSKALGVPELDDLIRRVDEFGRGFSFGMPQLAEPLDIATASSYVAREQTTLALAMQYGKASELPTVSPTQLP